MNKYIGIFIIGLGMLMAGMLPHEPVQTRPRDGQIELSDASKAALNTSARKDSTALLEGVICVLNDDHQPTSEKVPFVARRFPSWFEFGCGGMGDHVGFYVNDQGKAVSFDIQRNIFKDR